MISLIDQSWVEGGQDEGSFGYKSAISTPVGINMVRIPSVGEVSTLSGDNGGPDFQILWTLSEKHV